MSRFLKAALFVLWALFVACADETAPIDPVPEPVMDAGMDVLGEDVTEPEDVLVEDVREDPEPEVDTGEDVSDVAPGDVGEERVPLAGFGEISGECGVVGAMALGSPMSGFVLNRIDFGDDPWDEDDLEFLSEGGQEIWLDDNAGGSSKESEVFSFEVLHRCERAGLLKTENEILYSDPMGKITDILVEIGGLKVGVSVTRAVTFPRDAPYPVEQAADLLGRKLSGVLDSTQNVSEEDVWVKQILHVIAYSEDHAQSMRLAYEGMAPTLRADTIVIVTISDGADDFLY